MRNRICRPLLGAAILAFWAPVADAEPVYYDGVCEASAAAILDGTHFVVASDDLDHLTIYERGIMAAGPTIPFSGVSDIEAAARIDDTIFWLASHSYNKVGLDKQARRILFATSVTNGSLAVAGTRFTDLRARVASLLGTGEWPLGASLNIEGLADTPEKDLLVGLRGPLRDGRATIVRIENPFALVGLQPPPPAGAGTGMPQSVWWLDLGKRGIRSLERVGTGDHAYLILAGPVGELGDDNRPVLFWWDGRSETVTPGPAAALDDMAPEALIAWRNGVVQILGDNEANCSEGNSRRGPPRFPSIDARP
jgi:hypothetical protein